MLSLRDSPWILPLICFLLAVLFLGGFWLFGTPSSLGMDCETEQQVILLDALRAQHKIVLLMIGITFFGIYIAQLYVQTFFRNVGQWAHLAKLLRIAVPAVFGAASFGLVNAWGKGRLDACILDALSSPSLRPEIPNLVSYVGWWTAGFLTPMLVDQIFVCLLGLILAWVASSIWLRVFG